MRRTNDHRYRLHGRRVPVVALLGLAAAIGTAALAVPASSSGAASPRDAAAPASGASGASSASGASGASGPSCPWAQPGALDSSTPEQLADQVVAQMTLQEKLGIVDLGSGHGYENLDTGVPRLCIPSLTLQDGPGGPGVGDTGVTELPAPIALAATFQPLLATRYGRVIGAESRGQAIDAIQGPDLNLVRIPESGRSFETLGEDPTLASLIGVADVKGIQSQGTMAVPKHYTAYTQETARQSLNQLVSDRALAEVYDAPFDAAASAGAASVMCSYGELNGTPTCQDPTVLGALKQDTGFDGFVRSDLGAVNNPLYALEAGLDVIKPAATVDLQNAIAKGQLPISRLDDAVRRVLTEEFRFGLVSDPRPGAFGDNVITSQHTVVALEVAEQSIVLLKDAGSVLPLRRGRARPTVALIGSDAADAPATSGGGGAQVTAPFTVTPLQALQNGLGAGRVHYDPATSANPVVALFTSGNPAPAPAPPSTTSTSTTTSTSSTTSTTTTIPTSSSSTSTTSSSPSSTTASSAAQRPALQRPGLQRPALHRPGLHRPAQSGGITVTPTDETASTPQTGPGWHQSATSFTAPATGTYVVSMSSYGDAFLSMNGSPLVQSPGIENWQSTETATATVQLQAGTTSSFTLNWFSQLPAQPSVSIQNVSDALSAAASLAQQVQVPIVFARDSETEGIDRPNLALPGDQDALISAVAAANPRTVVVLDTGGAVLTPWLHQVAGLLEAWYPGEEDGNAIADVLRGLVDPSGRLPVTFPVTQQDQPLAYPASWPGIDATVDFAAGTGSADGLGIGYRGYLADHLKMRFPFGFGLSYTTFSLSDLSLRAATGGVRASVLVRNTGTRSGREVVEAYLAFPPSAGEPPEQLVAVGSAELAPGASATVALDVPAHAFQTDLGGTFQAVPGQYELSVGTSATHLTLHSSLAAPS